MRIYPYQAHPGLTISNEDDNINSTEPSTDNTIKLTSFSIGKYTIGTGNESNAYVELNNIGVSTITQESMDRACMVFNTSDYYKVGPAEISFILYDCVDKVGDVASLQKTMTKWEFPEHFCQLGKNTLNSYHTKKEPFVSH